MKDRWTVFTKRLLDFMFYAGILVTATLPVTIPFYGRYNVYFSQHKVAMIVLFGLSGVMALLIVRELRRMFDSVLAEDCFVRANVVSLRRMGSYSFCIAVLTAGRMILYPTPTEAIVILVFVIAGLFSKVLARVFDMAVSYKLENDLTI